MSLGRSGSVDLVRSATARDPRTEATRKSARDIVRLKPLQLTDFHPRLQAFVTLMPWNKIDGSDYPTTRMIKCLHALQMWGQAKEDFFADGKVYDFHGVTLGDFVEEMARRAGQKNVFIGLKSDLSEVIVGLRIPAPGRSLGVTFFFEIRPQELSWALVLSGNASGIGPAVD